MRQMLVGEDDEQPPDHTPADWVYQMLTNPALDGKIVLFPVWDAPMSAHANPVGGNETRH